MKREAGSNQADIVPVQMSKAVDSGAAEAPTIRFVNSVIERAITERASDIHLEPQEGEMVVRMRIDGVLDAWWKLASIFSGGMLGLFLMGVVCKTVLRVHAVVAVILGLLTIAWMSLSPLINEGSPFYRFHSPLHTYLTIVFGTTVIFLTGFLLTTLNRRREAE